MRKFNVFILYFIVLIGCSNQKKVISVNPEIDVQLKETQYYKLFTDATKHALFGNFQSAVPLYNKCISLYPERAAAYYQLSSIYIRSQDSNNGVKYALKSCQLDSQNIWYLINLANIYQYIGRLDSAAVLYKNILKKKDNDELKYNLATIYSQIGNINDAIDLLNEIDKRNPGSREILLMKHNLYNSKNEIDSAIHELELVTKYFPDDINNYGLLAEYLSDVGRRNHARRVYNEILQIDSSNGLALISYAEFFSRNNNIDSAFWLYRKAFINSDLKYNDKIGIIVGFINNSTFLNANKDRVIELLSFIKKEDYTFSYYAAQADIYINVNDLTKAKPYLDSALLYEKSNYLLWDQTLLINSLLLNNEEVIRIGKECNIYFKDKPNIFLYEAFAENNLNLTDSAIMDAEKVLNLNPELRIKIQAYSLLAELYRQKKINVKSDEYFERILEIEPNNLGIRNNYAYYLSLRKDNLQKAKELSKMTVEVEPDNSTYLDTYGWILYNMGKVTEAKIYIDKSIRNGAYNNPEVLDHYGDIMIKLNRCKEAIEAFEQIRNIDPEYPISNKLAKTRTECK